jgi:hypothetical protein
MLDVVDKRYKNSWLPSSSSPYLSSSLRPSQSVLAETNYNQILTNGTMTFYTPGTGLGSILPGLGYFSTWDSEYGLAEGARMVPYVDLEV